MPQRAASCLSRASCLVRPQLSFPIGPRSHGRVGAFEWHRGSLVGQGRATLARASAGHAGPGMSSARTGSPRRRRRSIMTTWAMSCARARGTGDANWTCAVVCGDDGAGRHPARPGQRPRGARTPGTGSSRRERFGPRGTCSRGCHRQRRPARERAGLGAGGRARTHSAQASASSENSAGASACNSAEPSAQQHEVLGNSRRHRWSTCRRKRWRAGRRRTRHTRTAVAGRGRGLARKPHAVDDSASNLRPSSSHVIQARVAERSCTTVSRAGHRKERQRH